MNSYIKNFVFPSLCFGVLAFFVMSLHINWLAYRELLLYTPFVLFFACAVIALYLLQYAFVYTCALFATVFTAIQLHLQITLDDPITFGAFALINLLWPLLLMLVVIISRHRLLSWSGLLLLMLISSLLWLPYILWSLDMAAIVQYLPSVFKIKHQICI